MKELLSYSQKGHSDFNEDIFYCDNNIVCVIDGATDVFKDEHIKLNNIVYDYVHYFTKILSTTYNQSNTLGEIIRNTVDKTYSYFNKKYDFDSYNEFELPTFSIACLKKNSSYYEYFILGDCCIVYKDLIGNHLIRDSRITKFVEYNRLEMKRLGIDPRKDLECNEIYKKTRMKANSPNGYPIGSVKGSGVKNAFCGRLYGLERAVLYTDGFIDYFSDCNINLDDLFDENILKLHINNSEKYYSNDNKYIEQLRPKQLDDRTIVLMTM